MQGLRVACLACAALGFMSASLNGCGGDTSPTCGPIDVLGFNPISKAHQKMTTTFEGVSTDCCTGIKEAGTKGHVGPPKGCDDCTDVTQKMSFGGGSCNGDGCSATIDKTLQPNVESQTLYGISSTCCTSWAATPSSLEGCPTTLDKICMETKGSLKQPKSAFEEVNLAIKDHSSRFFFTATMEQNSKNSTKTSPAIQVV